jgi:hypothetical protein
VDIASALMDIIFNRESFLPAFINDIAAAQKETLIVSPFVRKRRTMQMVQQLKTAISNNVRVAVVTRPVEEYKPAELFCTLATACPFARASQTAG